MRRVLIALASLAVTALPSFAAHPSAGAAEAACCGEKMQQDRMKGNPQHLLMMAYHKNVMVFGKTLAAVARQGDTVPRDVARTLVAEMRRSVEEMEKHRAESMRTVPEGMRGDRQKMMDEHLVNVKTQLRELEELTKGDRIPSQEVLRHLDAIFEACQGCAKMPDHGTNCGAMQQHGDNDEGGAGYCSEARPMMMSHPNDMMAELIGKMKAEDVETAKLVDAMKRAPRDKKTEHLAEIVERLVQQRAELTEHLENMQQHAERMQKQMMHQTMRYRGGYLPPPPPPGWGTDDQSGYQDEESDDVGSSDMNSNDNDDEEAE